MFGGYQLEFAESSIDCMLDGDIQDAVIVHDERVILLNPDLDPQTRRVVLDALRLKLGSPRSARKAHQPDAPG